ncbi:FAD-dependent oxidoreductase [Deinococcus hohokamensis]|uniref:FAD-dependent oxidoreductase n=1 Tax=Deinococcus hohokamensis TaxID=309883 RepID=A0ABV9IB66_9DEIO
MTRPTGGTVLVVGGGLIGSVVAFALRQAGQAVQVLDADLPGAAWRAGAGLLTPDGERLSGTALHADALDSLRRWPGLAQQLETHSGQSVHLRLGVLRVGPGAALRGGNVTPPPWPHPAARLTPGEARVHPPSVVQAALAGLPVVRARVLALVPEAGGVRVFCDTGEHHAALVVLAAGAWSGAFGLPVQAVQGQALLLEGGAQPALYGWRRGKGPAGYALGRPDGLYVGATARVSASAQPDLWARRWLLGVARRLVPAEADRPVRCQLVGLRPVGPGGLPLVGLHPTLPRVVVATGHGRHGALLAPLTALRVLGLVRQLGAAA